MTGLRTLDAIREVLASGNAVAFGFPVYGSIDDPHNPPGHIPYPREHDRQLGGHAVLAVGYDDDIAIEGRAGEPGALIIRNSWSTEWGEDGYGYLPYGYVKDELAVDFWTIYNSEWVN